MAPEPEDDEKDAAVPAPVAPSRAIALRPARSLAEAKLGEVILLGRHGQVLGPRRALIAGLPSWGVLGAMVGAIGVSYGLLIGPLAGVVAAAGMGLVVGLRLRHWPRFRAAVALASAARWEESRAILLGLERARLGPRFRDQIQVVLAALDFLLGEPESALRRLDATMPRLRGSSNAYMRLTRWRAGLLRVSVLARLGRVDEARSERDLMTTEITAWEARSGRSRGDYFELMLEGAQLAVAFAAGNARELPDEDVLHQWARAALLRTRFGSTLVYLAWAFHSRGDEDMARHLLAEAPARTPRATLPAEAPALQAWAEERRAAWGLG